MAKLKLMKWRKRGENLVEIIHSSLHNHTANISGIVGYQPKLLLVIYVSLDPDVRYMDLYTAEPALHDNRVHVGWNLTAAACLKGTCIKYKTIWNGLNCGTTPGVLIQKVWVPGSRAKIGMKTIDYFSQKRWVTNIEIIRTYGYKKTKSYKNQIKI